MAGRTEKHSRSAAVSGKETVEYRKVLAYLGTIINTLKTNEEAKGSLCLKCKEKKWIETTHANDPETLMGIILNRIETKVGTYEEFMTMLGNTVGMDLVEKEIREAKSKFNT